jgi:GNAT superfamily N-acetyltransferase
MPDMLVNLLRLPTLAPLLADVEQAGIRVRRAQVFEITAVRAFVSEHFSVGWADEISVGFGNKPVSVYLATRERRVVGFAAYECTRRAFFGPTGVLDEERGRGIGTALLVAALWGLREMGYVYAIIGSAGPTGFYTRTVGASPIPDSDPGIYKDILKK